MALQLALLAATAVVVAAAPPGSTPPLVFTPAADGSFTLDLGFTQLTSAGTAALVPGGEELFTPGFTASTGVDAWGAYNSTTWPWLAPGSSEPFLFTIVRSYAAFPNALTFEQIFVTGVLDTNTTGYAAKDSVLSVFPSFNGPATPLGFLELSGSFLDDDFLGPATGRWGATTQQKDGVFGPGSQSGPVVFFNEDASHAFVVSTMSSFMTGSLVVPSPLAPAGSKATNTLAVGLMGSLTSIPPGTSLKTVVWAGPSPNLAVMGWGSALLQWYGKPANTVEFDETANTLGYNTDHGSFFWYNHAPYSNYLEALLAVHNYSVAEGIPYKTMLLDSWWYYKGVGDGVDIWDATPDTFPGGNAGIQALVDATRWKVIAHNRYWSANSRYATANGGSYPFYVDAPSSPAGGQMALPLTAAFFTDLLNNKSSVFSTYLQDWLYNELDGVDLLTSDASAGRNWLLDMNTGAAAARMVIQLCMPYPRHALQSLEMSQATQIRVSQDHVPCMGEIYETLQWRIGYSSLFAWAIGLAPSKDNTWSTSFQPGGSCGNATDPAPALEQAVAVLSRGPVTFGDGVGYSNASMILRSCDADGWLLQPSRPATALDRQILRRAFANESADPLGEVWATYSLLGPWQWDHVLGAALAAPGATVTPADLVPIRADAAFRGGSSSSSVPVAAGHMDVSAALAAAAASPWASGPSVASTIAYAVDVLTWQPSSVVVQPFDAAHPLVLPAVVGPAFHLWHTAPVFTAGWALLGELEKMTPVSPRRFTSINVVDGGQEAFLTLAGAPGEAVAVSWYVAATDAVSTVVCTLDAAGQGNLMLPAGACAY